MNLLYKDALSRMQLMSLSKKSYSFRSGIMCLDDILKNFYAGTLVTIGGMSSMGKTTFALNLVNEFAIKQRHPLLFFSLKEHIHLGQIGFCPLSAILRQLIFLILDS